jgi:hypothetical protein
MFPFILESSSWSVYILYAIRNEFAKDGFKCTRSLALRAVALECDKASFFAGIPTEQ